VQICDISPGRVLLVTGQIFRPTFVVIDDTFYSDLTLYADIGIRLNVHWDSVDSTSNTVDDVWALVVDRDEWAASSHDHWPSVILLEPHGDHYRQFALAESSGVRVSIVLTGTPEPP
jgi:hypothetical protein